ncbi:MAG: DUF2066 domain-containing protein [Rickettsiales bacterium]
MKLFITCLTVIFSLAMTLPNPSWAGEALVTSEVNVDVTGKDAADARTQAMAKGEVDALIELLAKLTPPGQAQDIVATLDSKKITALVRGVEVSEEKITSDRYRARLIVSFDADAVSSLIKTFTTGEASEEASVVTGAFLIIPAYEEDGQAVLWGDDNPWHKAWSILGLEITAGDMIVPYGDNNDSAIVNINNVSSANYSALSPLAIRYGITDIVILQAKYTRAPDMMLTVIKRRINRLKNEINMLTYRADPQETRDTLLARAARDIADNMQTKKTEEVSEIRGVRAGDRNRMMILASITTLRSWTDLRARLSSLPMIDRIELLAMSPQQVDMVIHYRGEPESLAAGIVSQKIRLVKHDRYWVVSRD